MAGLNLIEQHIEEHLATENLNNLDEEENSFRSAFDLMRSRLASH